MELAIPSEVCTGRAMFGSFINGMIAVRLHALGPVWEGNFIGKKDIGNRR
jgi:hypothetical protein